MRIGTAIRFVLLLLIAFASAPMRAEVGAWSSYHNERFGTTADVPGGWRAGPPPANNDGLIFTSPDGAAELAISGSLNIWDDLKEGFDFYATPQKGEKITYKHHDRNSLTLSGTKGDRIFYAKHVLSCRGQIWNNIYLEYPAVRKIEFDDLVAHVAKSLRPGAGYQVENCSQ